MTAARRTLLLVGAALLAAGLLAGCGKKSGLEPPPGEEAQFTYPRAYPAPLPGTRPRDIPRPEETEPSRVSPFPDDFTSTTKTY